MILSFRVRFKKFRFWIVLASGIIPLIAQVSGANPGPLLIYSLFAFAFLLHERFPAAFRFAFRPVAFAGAVIGCGLLLEFSAWLSSYIARETEPALFHPQLIPDLLLASSFYGGWAIAWGLMLRWLRFGIWQAYAAHGVYGVMAEQDGLIMLSLDPMLWLYVFAAYGATLALALLPFRAALPGQKDKWWKYPLAIAASYLCTQFTFLAGALLWDGLGLVPPPRPIWEAPFF
jgi:hypothetical protein